MIIFYCLLFITFSHLTAQEWISSLNPITFSRRTVETLLKHGGYAIISAGRNPAIVNDLYLSDGMIEQRTKKLIDDIQDAYVYSSIIGSYDGGIERSFLLVLHNDSPKSEVQELVQLGEKYNQDSIIYAGKSSPPVQQMIYTTGHYRGRHVRGTGYEKLQPNITDNFSRIYLCSNVTFEFTLNFNFKYMYRNKIPFRTGELIDHHKRNQEANKNKCQNQ